MYPLTLNLLPKQTQAWDYLEDEVTTEVGYGGAAGGGKSYLGVYLALFLCKEFPGIRGFIGRKELKNLKRTTLVSLFTVAREQGITNYMNYNQQDSVIKFSNESEIVLVDTAYQPSDPLYTRFGSFEFGFGWVDESNESPVEGLNILRTRVGRGNWRKEWIDKLLANPMFRIWSESKQRWELKPIFLETFNPNKGHVYRRFYKPYKDKLLPEYRQFIPALPGDNPHLPDSYIQSLERADKITKERLLYGNFEYDDDSSKLMNYDCIQNIFSNAGIVKEGTKCIIVDVARLGKDKTTISGWNGLKTTNLIEIAKDTLDRQLPVIEELRTKLGIPKSMVLVDEDGVGGGLADFGGYKGFVANSSPIKPRLAEYDEAQKKQGVNYRNLKAQCAFLLADKVNANEVAIECEVSPKTKEIIIEDLDSYKRYKIDSDQSLQVEPKDKQKEVLGRSPDYGDLFVMRMYFELKPTYNLNPILL
jgi:phage terminase large subunit